MSKNRIIITGGSGFIGTNAIEYFQKKDYVILNIDANPPRNPAQASAWAQCDLLDEERLSRLFTDFNPQYVLHMAARTDLMENNSLQGYIANIEGTKNIINVLNKCKELHRVIFASSRMVCRIGYQPENDHDYCPPNLYGKSKVIMEQTIRGAEHNYEWIIVRPTSIWGPWFDVPYKIFFTTIAKRMFFNIRGMDPVKSFGFVGNTIYQLDRLFFASSDLVNKKTLYLCDYPPIEVRRWADLISRTMKLRPVPDVPYSLLRILAFAGDILKALGWYRVPLSTFRLNNLITDMVYDTRLLQHVCGDVPYGLEEGVRRTVQWMKDNGELS